MVDARQYNLELLTSFDARSSDGRLLRPEDGIRWLQELVQTRPIVAVLVKLRVDRAHVIISDSLTGDEMERIPAPLVSQPSVCVGDRILAPHDNVLVFTVLEDTFHLAPPEMYFFQCLDCPAQEVVNVLKAVKDGIFQQRASNASPFSGRSNSSKQEYDDRAVRSAQASEASEMYHRSANAESAISGKKNQLNKLLDRCLDDIEKFAQRLQMAAEAYTKLEQRRLERQGTSDASGLGDGMLMMRARAPSAEEFVSVLQKFKLAFNCLASLKGHIHNPNAPEMIHYLFKPLTMVIDSVRDPATGAPTLAQNIVTPLLTVEAVQLLSDCLTSRESQLWKSLGDKWFRSKDQFPASTPVYIPVFADGWSPPSHWMDDSGVPLSASYGSGDLNQQLHRANVQGEDAALVRGDRKLSVPVTDNKLLESDRRESKRSSAIYPISEVTGVTDEKQQKFAWELLARGAKVFFLVEGYVAHNAKELTVRKGEVVEILDDSRNWWNVRNSLNETGFVPCTLLTAYKTNDQEYYPRDNGASGEPRQGYAGGESRQSNVAPPPPIARQDPPVVMRSSVIQPAAVADPRSGQYPSSPPIALQRLYDNPPPPVVPRNRASDEYHRPSSIAAPAFGYQDAPIAQRSSVSDQIYEDPFDMNAKPGVPYQRTAVDDLNDEFRRKISGVEAIKPRQKAPQIAYITRESTVDEVLYWLQVKGFSYNVQQQLAAVDGQTLFSMSKAKLEMMFGVDEGSRLYSNILVQRNVSGYKTLRSAELQQMLNIRKKKTESALTNGTTESL